MLRLSMAYQRIALSISIMLFLALPLRGQLDFTKYFDESSIPLLDPDDHLDPVFVWDMPGNVQIHLNEGINYLKEGDLLLAVSNFDEALKLDPDLWIAHYYRGVCHKNLRNFKDAEKDLLRALTLRNDAVAYVELGEVYHVQNSFERAADEYNKALVIDPKMAQAYYNLGSLWLEIGRAHV